MSGLLGVFDPTGRPIDRDEFERVAACPCGVSRPRWLSVLVFAGHRDGLCQACPGQATDRRTASRWRMHRGQDLPTTFDGRLDNREELAAQLDLRVSAVTPDSVLVAAAYRRWGVECPARLLGDFSLVVCDSQHRRLLVARDIFGLRPLFTVEKTGDAWWWASDQRALVSLQMPPINEGYIGELLSDRITTVDETVYQGLHRLPMAHAELTIGARACAGGGATGNPIWTARNSSKS